MKVYFGKYRGLSVDEIPSDYLKWLTFQDWCEENCPNLLKEVDPQIQTSAP